MNEENKDMNEALDHDPSDQSHDAPENQRNESHKWFVVRIATGKENKFKDLLENELKSEHGRFFSEIMVPTEVIELRAGAEAKS